MERFNNVRIWEVRFQTMRPLETFPMPHEVVLEKQTSLRYHLEGRSRPGNMTQLEIGRASCRERVYDHV